MTRALILGGGFAGVLFASVLSAFADEVALVEGAEYQGAAERTGLPQAHHNHVLVTGGARALDELLPGCVRDLLAHGAQRRVLSEGALILHADGWFRRQATEADLLSCSRWLLDDLIRRRVLADGRVSVLEDTRAIGFAGGERRIDGVVVRRPGGGIETVAADLVVDATGRRSQAPRWLAEIGGPAVDEEMVDSGLAYATRFYRAPAALAARMPAIMLHPSGVHGPDWLHGLDRPGSSEAPDTSGSSDGPEASGASDASRAAEGPARGATLFPIEGGRWIVTLTGTRGGHPPVDEAGFAAFARSLRSPIVAELMACAEPLSAVRPYRDTANRRRYFERVAIPEGLLVVGDALAAVNPVHSHGMSVAALSALRTREVLAQTGARPDVFPKVQAVVAAQADRSWRMATAADRRRTTGPASDSRTPFQRQAQAAAARRRLSGRALMAELFRAQTLLPPDPARARELLQELAKESDRLLTEDEAIGQYPDLAAWRASQRHRGLRSAAA